MSKHNFFEFTPAPRANDARLVVEIPIGIRATEVLLVALANGLSFPAYFGCNWNAVDECITDLTWLKQNDIALVHNDFPDLCVADQKTYVEVLNDAVAYWKNHNEHSFSVYFPHYEAARIEFLLHREYPNL